MIDIASDSTDDRDDRHSQQRAERRRQMSVLSDFQHLYLQGERGRRVVTEAMLNLQDRDDDFNYNDLYGEALITAMVRSLL